MSTATLKKPPTPRATDIRRADAEAAIIDRKLQNTEVLTLKHQIDRERLTIEIESNKGIDALIERGDTKGALTALQNVRAAAGRQESLLLELERAEKRDVDLVEEDAQKVRHIFPSAKPWRPGDAG